MESVFNSFKRILVACIAALISEVAFSQDISVRNNLVWDAAGAPNIGVEYPVAKHMSVGANAGLKPWPRFFFWDTDYVNNTKHWKHLVVAPEFRYYLDQVYDGLFTGADFIYTHYNVGNVKFPFGLYPDVVDHRVQGDFFGAGIFAGYSWWLGSHWRIEAEAGVGAGLAAYDKFECEHCGTRLGEESKLALIPKLGINIAYNVLPHHEWIELVSQVQIDTVKLIRPLLLVAQVKEIEDERTNASEIAGNNHWVTPIDNYRTIDEIIAAPMDSVRYVTFPLDSITLYKDFAGNSEVLDEILSVSRKIIDDSRDSLALIQIVGLASVEGDWKHNKWLGEGRAEALKQYVVRELGLDDSQVEAQGRGEAWNWFRGQISALVPDGGKGISGDDASWILDMIDNEPDPAKREEKLKAKKSLYKALKDNILHDQRNSGYVHIYYGTKPDPVAGELNRINGLITDHKYSDAVKEYESNSEYMDRVKVDAEAANAYGIALFGSAVELEQIDTVKAGQAMDILRKADEMGSDCARGNIDGANEFLNKYNEYMEQKRSQEAMREEMEKDSKARKKK
jgi:outer membrane protein OmpA-like peptidoglycan-associated protein